MKKWIQTLAAGGNPAWVAILLGAATFALFAPAIGYDFVNYDDPRFAKENYEVLKGLTWGGVHWAFQFGYADYWHPVTWLSLMVDVSLFGRGAGGMHLTNVLLHTANGVLLFLLLRRMTGAHWRSAIVAALFALHPLRVESVAWVTERKDVLSLFFGLISLWFYARWAQARGERREAMGGNSTAHRPSPIAYCLSLLFFALGLMSKPLLMTVPFVLLLLDYWPLRRWAMGDGRCIGFSSLVTRHSSLLWEKIPFFVLMLASVVITWMGQQRVGAVVSLAESSLAVRLAKVPVNYATYLSKTLWPANLALPYDYPASFSVLTTGICLLLLAVVTLFALRTIKSRPYLAVGWFWYLGTLVPMIGLVQVGGTPLADRFTYLPIIGALVAVVWLVADAFERWCWPRGLAVLLAAAALLGCTMVTSNNLPRWQNSITLFEDTLRKGNHPVAYKNLSAAYNDHREYDRTFELCAQAIRLYPDCADLFINRGIAYKGRGDINLALADFDQAIKLDPSSPEAYNNRGGVYVAKADFDHALRDFTIALRLDPLRVKAWSNRAYAWNAVGNHSQAIRDCNSALQIDAHYVEAYNNRGIAHQAAGDPAAALADYNRAIQINPAFPMSYNNRAAIRFQSKQYDEAWADIRRCRELGGKPSAALVRDLQAASGRNE